MKKLFGLLLVITMVLGAITGCSSSKETADTKDNTDTTTNVSKETDNTNEADESKETDTAFNQWTIRR